MKKALLGLSIVAIFVLAAAPAALACEKGGCKGHSMVMCQCFDKKLGLSEDQQKKLDALRAKTEKKAAPHMKKLMAAKEAIKALWAADKPRRKAILVKMNQIHAMQKKLGVVKLDAHLALIKILTAEQKQTLMKEKETCCKGGVHPKGCTCPKCKGEAKGCPPGCQCPKCKQKAAKDSGCKDCPKKDCPHHK
jgi:Spy/CpxP family protein refolding chaperone